VLYTDRVIQIRNIIYQCNLAGNSTNQSSITQSAGAFWLTSCSFLAWVSQSRKVHLAASAVWWTEYSSKLAYATEHAVGPQFVLPLPRGTLSKRSWYLLSLCLANNWIRSSACSMACNLVSVTESVRLELVRQQMKN